jgi:hypothetical protein
MKPKELVAHFRTNQNNNKTLKTVFASQFLGKLESEELDGLVKSIHNEKDRREMAVINEKIAYLKSKGFDVVESAK